MAHFQTDGAQVFARYPFDLLCHLAYRGTDVTGHSRPFHWFISFQPS